MPKTTKKATGKKATAKRTVTCGKCKEKGHNARSCSTKKEIKSSADIPTPPTAGRKTKIDMRHEQTEKRMRVPKRDAPTANNSGADAAPYRCEKCNAVAILVIVKVKDYNESFKQKKEVFAGETRCEMCMNKPIPSDLILKWGAAPGEVVEVPGEDA